jgi:hypothetical protein
MIHAVFRLREALASSNRIDHASTGAGRSGNIIRKR